MKTPSQSATLRNRTESQKALEPQAVAATAAASAGNRTAPAAATQSSTGRRDQKASTTANATAAARTSSLFFLYASLAGTCGALSAVVGKLAVAATLAPRVAAAAVAFLASHNLLPFFLSVVSRLPTRNGGVPGGHGAEGTVPLAQHPHGTAEAEARLAFWVEMVFRLGFFLTNAFFTGQMWRFFLKSLSLGPTPVSQIINTGTNFAVSAFLGLVFFREEVNLMWAAGALLVVAGLALVVTDPQAAKVTS